MPEFVPLRFLLVMFNRWVNRHQRVVIEYPRAENRVLKSQLERDRIHRPDDPGHQRAERRGGT